MNRQSSHAAGRTGHIAAFITILIWGTTFISTKVLLRTFTPIEILFVRFVIGYLALWLVRPKRLAPAARKEEWYFAAAGLCGITLYYLCENVALTFTLASNVGVIISIAPFFTALFGCIFLKDKRPSPRFYLGFVIAIIGICLISFTGVSLSLIHILVSMTLSKSSSDIFIRRPSLVIPALLTRISIFP